MKLVDVGLFPVELESLHPGGPRTPDLRQHLVVRLETDDGHVGWGEITGQAARPLSGPNVHDLRDCLGGLLLEEDPLNLARIHERLTAGLASAGRANSIRCGVDLALHDLIGKRLGVPVHVLLGGALRTTIPVAYPIPAHRRMEHVPASIVYMGEMLERGFALVRFYIGLNLDADAHCLRLMRETYGDRVRIKTLDCNGHLDWKAARAAIRQFWEYGFMLVESPARRGDYAGLAAVRRDLDVPVSEHAFTLADAMKLVAADAVDVFNVTINSAGGIFPARKIAAVAEGAGIGCLLGGAHELSLGAAGQAHLGATMGNLAYPADCIGPMIYPDDVVVESLSYGDGAIRVPDGPGLGLAIDEGKLARHAVAIDAAMGA
jgi:L-alanine-DL-glutamate epimerase-like enolase superfamily enzyme